MRARRDDATPGCVLAEDAGSSSRTRVRENYVSTRMTQEPAEQLAVETRKNMCP
jgi:hypothetical protein